MKFISTHPVALRRPRRAGVTRSVLSVLALLLVSAACADSGTDPRLPETAELGVVLGSVDLTLTVFDPDNTQATRTIGLAPAGSPVGFAVRGGTAAVPLGVVSALAVVDLESATVLRTIALRDGSGATGAAFVSDSIVLVANPNLNSATPVNVFTGELMADVAVGVFPQFVGTYGDRAYVLNANLVNFAPDGPGSVSVVDAATLEVSATVALSGLNPGSMTSGADGRLYVVNAGAFAAGNGSLSVVDPAALEEVAHHDGFGEFPGAVTSGADGRLYVSSFAYGVAIWDPASRGFVRPPTDALVPDGTPSSSGLGVDSSGRLYSLEPQCQEPASAFRFDVAYEVEASVAVGICPTAIRFTTVETPAT